MKIAITLPVYHSDQILANFTEQALESIQSEKHDITVYVVVNYTLPELIPIRNRYKLHPCIKQFFVFEGKDNSVSRAWNSGIRAAIQSKVDYVMVINNDIIFQKNAIDNLVDFAEKHQECLLWTGSDYHDLRTIRSVEDNFEDTFDSHPHFSCFMINKKTVDTVGYFDEKLKMAYFEDGDYHYRILLAGYGALKTNRAKFYHYGSRSINVDDELKRINKRYYEDNRAYLRKKWGVDFHNKAFDPPESIIDVGYKYPFNKSNK